MLNKILDNNYFYYTFIAFFFDVVFYFAYTISGCSVNPLEIGSNEEHIGGTPPYYDGHDDQIEPNPNKWGSDEESIFISIKK